MFFIAKVTNSSIFLKNNFHIFILVVKLVHKMLLKQRIGRDTINKYMVL